MTQTAQTAGEWRAPVDKRWHTSPSARAAYLYVPKTSKLPGIGETEGQADPIVHVKLFDPMGQFTWYLTEADRETGEAFGYVVGFENELGYIDLNELAEVGGRGTSLRLPIERDIHFTPTPLSKIQEKHS